jgi:hypothetical protein
MYDFYKNPPKNKQELREWLTSWLEPVSSDTPLLELNDNKYIQESGFRRAFHKHCVLRNISTMEYVWWVFSGDDSSYLTTFPEQKFSNYDQMLNYVIDDYYKSWNLTD